MSTPRIPLWLKLAYTAWMALWVPVYWSWNGPSNFLWICDFANFVTLAAIWSESALLASSQLAGIAVIQVVWAVDFFGRALLGFHPVGGTEYMFDPADPLWLRCFSLFHLWTLPLVAWLVWRLGHDRRGLWLQTAIAAVLYPLGRVIGTRDQNLNWTWKPFGVDQVWLPPWLYVLLLIPLSALLLFYPGDLLGRWLAGSAKKKRKEKKRTIEG